MKYEISESGTHEITSDDVLCCKETGRVIAVFYNDYDLDDVIKLEKENEELKQQIIKLTRENESLGKRHVELSKLVVHWKELYDDAEERAQEGFYNCRDKRIENEELKSCNAKLRTKIGELESKGLCDDETIANFENCRMPTNAELDEMQGKAKASNIPKSLLLK